MDSVARPSIPVNTTLSHVSATREPRGADHRPSGTLPCPLCGGSLEEPVQVLQEDLRLEEVCDRCAHWPIDRADAQCVFSDEHRLRTVFLFRSCVACEKEVHRGLLLEIKGQLVCEDGACAEVALERDYQARSIQEHERQASRGMARDGARQANERRMA